MFCLHACRHSTCIPSAFGSQRWFWSPGTGVKDGCEPPCGCCAWNLGPQQEHQGVLDIFPTPSFQAFVCRVFFFWSRFFGGFVYLVCRFGGICLGVQGQLLVAFFQDGLTLPCSILLGWTGWLWASWSICLQYWDCTWQHNWFFLFKKKMFAWAVGP